MAKCPNCGDNLDYIDEYGEWYCNTCRQYQQPLSPQYYRPSPTYSKWKSSKIIGVLTILIVIIVILAIIMSSMTNRQTSSNNNYENDLLPDDELYEEDNEENNDYDPCGEEYFYREYNWNFSDKKHTFEICIPEESYYYLTKQPRTDDYSNYVQVAEHTLSNLSVGLKEKAEKMEYDYYETINYILSFVQDLKYTSDKVTTGYDDYPRYAIETLVERGGDCEDTSILFAGFMENLDYDAILILITNETSSHMAVGMWGHSSFEGTYIEVDEKHYYYCETTYGGWKMGDCPEDYKYVVWNYILV